MHTHASENRDEVEVVRRMSGGLSNLEYLADTGLATAAPLHRALRLGHRRRTGADGRARRQGPALPRLEPEARLGHRAGRRDAGARHLGLARRRRRRLQQPAGHVRRDAARRDAPGDAQGARACSRPATSSGWRRARVRARSGWRARSARSSRASGRISSSSTATAPHLAPAPDPWSTIVYAARGTDVRTVVVDGEVLVHDFALTRDGRSRGGSDGRERPPPAELAGRAGICKCFRVIMLSSRCLRVLNHHVDAS